MTLQQTSSISKLYSDESWTPMFENFMKKLKQSVEYESGSLFLFEDESQTLHKVVSDGDGIDFISSVNFPYGRGLSAWVAQKGKQIYLHDIHRGSRHGLKPVRSYLSMPLEINNRIVGVLNLCHTVPNAFGRNTMEKIEDLSRGIARVIYNKTFLDFVDEEDSSY